MKGTTSGEPPVIALVGPTAVGKSALALRLAEQYSGDIISADSRQIYRYMDIGTAKPTPDEQAKVRHYLVDLIEPSETYSAQRFREEGSRVLVRIRRQGRVPLVVGGTGFYVRALLDGLSIPTVPPDPELRERLRAEAERSGSAVLHDRLASRDPASAARIHPRNLPRIVRALEIVEKSGGPVPELEGLRPVPALYIGLWQDRGTLRDAAADRARAQVAAGLLEETALLLAMGYSRASPALMGFGYRQMVACLDGRTSLDEAVEHYITDTHRYIRRQMTWFRADKRIVWIEAGESAFESAVRLIDDALSRRKVDGQPA